MGGPLPETERDRSLLADVATRGWHVVDVPFLGPQPGWAFTVGLTRSFAHPELVVFGLPDEANLALLERLAARVAQGESFRPGAAIRDPLPGLRCEIQVVAEVWQAPLLGYAVWFHAGEAFSALQIRWPDRAGRLPGDPACDPEIANLQPRLEHEDVVAAGAEALLHALDIR